MSQAQLPVSADGESLLALPTLLLNGRRRIARYMLGFGLAAAAAAASRPKLYSASAAFFPQGSDPARSGLASLADQFGISVPSGNLTQSSDFYLRILRSRVVLQRIARDTFDLPERGGQRVAFLDLFEIPAGPAQLREQQAVRLLQDLVETSAVKTTSVVQLSVATRWPSVSLAIATALLDGVDEFNQGARRNQASAERQFIESRLSLASTELRAAEDRLELFLRTNRDIGGSPELAFRRDRLQRDVALRQQVYTMLSQSSEDVRLREVRDTPLIATIEPAAVSAIPEPRRRVLITLLGVLVGGIVGSIVAFASEMLARLRREGDAAAEELVRSLAQARDDVLGPLRRLSGRTHGINET